MNIDEADGLPSTPLVLWFRASSSTAGFHSDPADGNDRRGGDGVDDEGPAAIGARHERWDAWGAATLRER